MSAAAAFRSIEPEEKLSYIVVMPCSMSCLVTSTDFSKSSCLVGLTSIRWEIVAARVLLLCVLVRMSASVWGLRDRRVRGCGSGGKDSSGIASRG
jgi:hypothetical protein